MRLIKCYVSSFGKLNDFTYDFAQGLNTIKQDNGWGKSTFATFIKAMFYGLNSSKRTVAENERIKYRTWNSTQMLGGYVEFEWGGQVFKLERYFGNKESEDTVRLFDRATGKEYSNTDNLGKRIFQIDEEGFLSTTYFSQKDFQAKSNSSLTAKFNSVCEIQDTEAFDTALEKLEAKSKQYKMRGDKGIIADTKREINTIENQLSTALASRQVVKTLKQEILELEAQTSTLKNQSIVLTEQINNLSKTQVLAVKKERHDELVCEIENTVQSIKKIDEVLKGNSPTDEELSSFSECYNDLIRINNVKKSTDEEVERLKNICSKESSKKSEKNKFIALYMVAVVFAVFGVVGLFFNTIIAALGFACCAAMIGVAIWYGLNRKGQQESAYLNMLNEQLDRQKQCDNLHGEYTDNLLQYLSRYNVSKDLDMLSAFSLIKDCVYQKRLFLSQINKLQQQLKEFDEIKNEFSNVKGVVEDSNTLRAKLAQTQEEYSLKATLLANKRASLKIHEQTDSTIADLENKKAECLLKLQQYEQDYKTVLLAIEYLTKADESLKVKYRAPLQESLNKYLVLIDKQSKANIDIDFTIMVSESSGQKSTEYYSKGYQNLFEICKRFALTDVLFTTEKPFIILDDPFYNLDDKKLCSSLSLIEKLSEEYQILYLVCHESRMPKCN